MWERFMLWLSGQKAVEYGTAEIAAKVISRTWTIEEAAAATGLTTEQIARHVAAEIEFRQAPEAAKRAALTVRNLSKGFVSARLIVAAGVIGVLASVAYVIATSPADSPVLPGPNHPVNRDISGMIYDPATGSIETDSELGIAVKAGWEPNPIGLQGLDNLQSNDVSPDDGPNYVKASDYFSLPTSQSPANPEPVPSVSQEVHHPWDDMTGMQVRQAIAAGGTGTHLFAVTNPVYAGGHYVFIDPTGQRIMMSIHDCGVLPFEDLTAGMTLAGEERYSSDYYARTEVYTAPNRDSLHKSYVR